MSASARQWIALLSCTAVCACSQPDFSIGPAPFVPQRQSTSHASSDFALRANEEVAVGSGWRSPYGVAFDATTHDLYVSETAEGVVKKMAPDGTITVIASGLNNVFGLAVDSTTHDVYVCEAYSRVRKIAPNGTITTLGDFNAPLDVAVDQSTHDVYVVDSGDQAVKKVARDGNITVVWEGISPSGVAFDSSSGDLYVSDQIESTVVKIDEHGRESQIGGLWARPRGVAVDPVKHTVYVISKTVQRVDPNGTRLTVSYAFKPSGVTVDPTTHAAYVTDAESGNVFRIESPEPKEIGSGFDSPIGVAIDQTTQSVVVVDAGHNLVKRVVEGSIVTLYNSGTSIPYGAAVDYTTHETYVTAGNKLVVLSGGGAVSRELPVFEKAAGVAVDPIKHVAYVADPQRHIVVVVQPNDSRSNIDFGTKKPLATAYDEKRSILYVASIPDSVDQVSADGTIRPVASGWSSPVALAVDSTTGYLYVTDGSDQIRRVTTDGKVTVIGSGFVNSLGLAVDPLRRDLYVSDTYRNVVWRLLP